MDPTNSDFSFNWTIDWNNLCDPDTPSTKEKTLHDNYEKNAGFTINNLIVRNVTKSINGTIEASKCILNHVSGREDVTLYDCSAPGSVSSSYGRVKWIGWNESSPKAKPDVSGRDGVKLLNVSARNVCSSYGQVIMSNGKANEVSGRDGIILGKVTAKSAETSYGKLGAKNCNIKTITAREGIELIDSRVGTATSSYGSMQAEGCTIDSIDVRDDVKLKNCSGSEVKSTTGKIQAVHHTPNIVGFNLLSAPDGVFLRNISAKNIDSKGPVKCYTGTFDSIKLQGTSSLKIAQIQHLEISVEKNKEISIYLTGTKVGSIAIKVNEAIDGANLNFGHHSVDYASVMSQRFSDNPTLAALSAKYNRANIGAEGSTAIFGPNCVVRTATISSKSQIGDKITWSKDGSTLNATPSNFVVTGTLLNEFKQDILKRCAQGTKGLINGAPAKVTRSGIEILESSSSESSEESVITKVTITGGTILENITVTGLVQVDTSGTKLIGKLVV